MTNARVDRRHFLRCSSYMLALPFLASLPGARPLPRQTRAKRLVCVAPQLGFYKPEFFGEDPRLLRPLDAAGLSDHFTTFSGLDHAGPLANGHDHVFSFLTGKIAPGVSLDQFVAPVLGNGARYESFQLCAGKAASHPTLSFSASGVPMPVTLSPTVLFAKIFGAGSLALAQQRYLIDSGKSLLDGLSSEAKSLQGQVNGEDRDKLDEYFSSIRGLEAKLGRRRDWLDKPFPKAPAQMKLPELEVVEYFMMLENADLMWDLMTLAIQNDSTRVMTLTIPNGTTLLFDGDMMPSGYHQYSHHGNDPSKIENLLKIEERHMAGAARFLSALKATPDPDGGSMLDSTITLLGSAMGDAATHARTNFPLLVAGGGFDHQRHISCRTRKIKNRMACDLFVSILNKLGFDVDQFGSSRSHLNDHFA